MIAPRFRQLLFLSIASLLAMGLWFSASAVVPQLVDRYALGAAAQAWLTMSVQIGFVVGALGSAVLNLADRVAAHRLFIASAFAAAGANAAMVLFDPAAPGGLAGIMALRFATGALLAGVYPPGMKVLSSWFTRGRGLALGVMVGGLSIGSGGPHLLAALASGAGPGGAPDWRTVILLASAAAFVGGLLALATVRPGDHLPPARAFSWRHAAIIFTDPAVRRANFGYLGHMWELYAMWTWVPLCVLGSYEVAGWSPVAGRLAGFAIIAVGGIGSVLAGWWSDRRGRTLTASAALVVSGGCALVAGFTVAHPVLLTAVCIVWGVAVVADSAQFSTAVSELCDPRYVGTALTMQTCSGFLLTLVTIRLLNPIRDEAGWGIAFAVLALGPVFGVIAMLRLRGMPQALRMAAGKR